ncbi:zinc transporter 10-like isoform X4 [Portunus trituberculatus]|uniref:zinc transporter 10-like isoform X4 n=1 Tax=Portunus trituberculatus TaxID=210409 RepID=UPI001E1CB95E|nr:zinc transporter 10-like isoform X4 [Portunus trituberculatus]
MLLEVALSAGDCQTSSKVGGPPSNSTSSGVWKAVGVSERVSVNQRVRGGEARRAGGRQYYLAMAEAKKDLLRQIPRVKLWLVLTLTLAFTAVLLVAAHLTHSLALRVEAYHALYNVLTLCGCLLAMKVSSGPQSLHNTFGWARLEVLSMLFTLLFLTALCFSVSIDSVQTALHVGHQDAMHHPLPVLALGGGGLALNALVFCLIGGYTHHQGCFLEMRDSGSVWVGRQVTQEAVQAGRRTLSSDALARGRSHRARQICKEVVRDTCGLVIMMVCAAVVHWDNGGVVALYIDPALAVTSAALLIWLSHPYGKECCHILLQTIPGHIDVEDFHGRVMKEFPAIVNVHHLHIWTLTPSKVVATAHVVFVCPRVYLATKDALRQFFLDEGITHVTIQPECLTTNTGTLEVEDPSACLLRCKFEQCFERECCKSCSPHAHLSSVSSSGGMRHTGTPGEASCSGAASHECEAVKEQDTPRAGGENEVSGAVGTLACELERETDAATAPPDTSHDALLSKETMALQDLGAGACEASQPAEVPRKEKTVVFASLKGEHEVEKPSHPSPAQDVTVEQVDRLGEQDGAARTRARITTAGVSPEEEPTDRTCLLEHRC